MIIAWHFDLNTVMFSKLLWKLTLSQNDYQMHT